MPIPVIPEYIQEVARAAGNAHMSIKNGVGDDNTPGSALFELGQLQDLANYQVPRFGVISNSIPFFAVTPDIDPHFLQVAGGQIGYNQQIITVAPQQLAVARNFGPILSTSSYDSYQYGVVIGFPLSEAQKASLIYATTVSQSASAGDQILYLSNTSVITDLGFPIAAYVNVNYVLFSGIDSTTGALRIDPSFNNGQLLNGAALGSPVNFIYTPHVMALCGLPVSTTYQSSGDPATFAYYPPMPNDWLSIANALMVRPRDPYLVVVGGDTNAIMSTLVEYPAPNSNSGLFSPASAAQVAEAVSIAYNSVSSVAQNADVSDTIRALQNYTSITANSPSISFRQYWASQPFTATSFYGLGTSFDNVERFEFPDSFIQAYYDLTGNDLQHTFAVFRGDLYSGGNRFALTSPTVSANTYIASGIPSVQTKGTYIYGVSTITSTGESTPNYVSAVSNSSSGSYFINEVLWTPVTNALYYHIYRKATIVGEQQEYRLTNPNEIIGSQLTVPVLSVPSLTDSQCIYAISHLREAMQFTVPSAGGTDQQHLGGIGLILKTSQLFPSLATDAVTISLYSDSSGPNTLLATGTNISYTSLSTSFATYYSQLDYTLQPNTSYWIVIGQTSALPGGVTLSLNTIATGSGKFANNTLASGGTWSIAGHDGYYILLNYLDCGRPGVSLTSRGIKLTGKVSLIPSQLSIYVPLLNVIGYTSPNDLEDVDPTTGYPTTSTQNEMVVTVTARLGANGAPTVLPPITIPQGSARGYRALLGTSTQLFDRIDDVQVTPGQNINLRIGAQNTISWSFYDFLTIETSPT